MTQNRAQRVTNKVQTQIGMLTLQIIDQTELITDLQLEITALRKELDELKDESAVDTAEDK